MEWQRAMCPCVNDRIHSGECYICLLPRELRLLLYTACCRWLGPPPLSKREEGVYYLSTLLPFHLGINWHNRFVATSTTLFWNGDVCNRCGNVYYYGFSSFLHSCTYLLAYWWESAADGVATSD